MADLCLPFALALPGGALAGLLVLRLAHRRRERRRFRALQDRALNTEALAAVERLHSKDPRPSPGRSGDTHADADPRAYDDPRDRSRGADL